MLTSKPAPFLLPSQFTANLSLKILWNHFWLHKTSHALYSIQNELLLASPSQYIQVWPHIFTLGTIISDWDYYNDPPTTCLPESTIVSSQSVFHAAARGIPLKHIIWLLFLKLSNHVPFNSEGTPNSLSWPTSPDSFQPPVTSPPYLPNSSPTHTSALYQPTCNS